MAFELNRINRIREYETIYITKSELTEEQMTELMGLIDQVITENNGTVLRTTLMGKRKLFYEIKGNLRGSYVHTVFLGDNKLVSEFERKLRINENVLRYQTLKQLDHVKDVEARKAYYHSPKFEEVVTIMTKPTKEVKDDYDKFRPKGV